MRVCLYCNNVLLKSCHRRKTYCNNRCFILFRQKSWIERWLKGEESGIVVNKGANRTSARIRNYLIKVRGEKCERCGWKEINPLTGHSPIELEHIDGHWDNNKIENLTLLCPNCHSLTPTYRSLNTGKGRRIRRIGSAATAAVL
jgi:HNH endonuclease